MAEPTLGAVRELVYVSRAKLGAFALRGGLLRRIRPGNVEVSLPGVRIGADTSMGDDPPAVPWAHLKAVEKNLRKTAVDVDSSNLDTGRWFRFNLPMIWAVGDEIEVSGRTYEGDLVLFASVDPTETGHTAVLLCGSKGHLIADRGATSVRSGPSYGQVVLAKVEAWVNTPPGDAEDRSPSKSNNAFTAYRMLTRERPNRPTRLSGYARVLDVSDPPGSGIEGFIVATPLVVEYARAPN